jgi:hypothetical protein
MNYGDALVIGNLGWHQTGRAFEGLRGRLSLGAAWVDAFLTQPSEGRPLSDPLAAGDQYFYGVYANLGPMVADGMGLDVYLLGQTSPTTNGVVDDPNNPTMRGPKTLSGTEMTLGTRAAQELGSFDYRAEAGLQFGSRPAVGEATSVLAYQVDAEVGVRAPFGVRFSVGGLVASGDDPETSKSEAYNQLYPTAHKFLGLSDIFGARSNVGSLNSSLTYKAMSALTLKAQGHAVWALETAPGVKGYSGTEIDSHVVLALGAGLTLRTMYALVLASADGPLGDDGPAHYWETELSYTLK